MGCGRSATNWVRKKPQTLLLTAGAAHCRTHPSSEKTPTAPTEAEWRVAFRPHAIIATDRSVPSPIFVAALIGVERILRIELDTSLPKETYAQQALAKLPEQTIAFGRPIGVTVNYAPDRAVLYDLKGDPIETLTAAVRCGEATLIVPPAEGDLGDRLQVYIQRICE